MTAPPCLPPPLLVHLSSLEVNMDQSEVCLVYSVRWSLWSEWSMIIHCHSNSSKFILIHLEVDSDQSEA